jgi:hypothetical protein
MREFSGNNLTCISKARLSDIGINITDQDPS